MAWLGEDLELSQHHSPSSQENRGPLIASLTSWYSGSICLSVWWSLSGICRNKSNHVTTATTTALEQYGINSFNAKALLSSKAQERRKFWKPFKPCSVGIHRKALAESYQMSTHLLGFLSIFRFFCFICYLPNEPTAAQGLTLYYRPVAAKKKLSLFRRYLSQNNVLWRKEKEKKMKDDSSSELE